MLRRLHDIEWTFSNTAETATGLMLAIVVVIAVLA
jgi:hypothetical protein